MTIRLLDRANTPRRWQAALRRAHAEGIEVRQLAGCGMWIGTSASDTTVAYEVTPWSCECHAGQFGDPVCKHRAAMLETLGRLSLDLGPGAPAKCNACNGTGAHPDSNSKGGGWRSESVACRVCHGTGLTRAPRAA